MHTHAEAGQPPAGPSLAEERLAAAEPPLLPGRGRREARADGGAGTKAAVHTRPRARGARSARGAPTR
eukprot:5407176-Lingulodinium_polyedra.AAC.1